MRIKNFSQQIKHMKGVARGFKRAVTRLIAEYRLIKHSGLFFPKRYFHMVGEIDIDPIIHFLEKGAYGSTNPHPLFDMFYYRRQYGKLIKDKNPLIHYLTEGAQMNCNPHPLFDTAFYTENYPEVLESGMNPLVHFLEVGGFKGYKPHPLFDSDYYLEQNKDVRDSSQNPLFHYIAFGCQEGRSPSRSFDFRYYYYVYPDIASSKMNPLLHYVLHGAKEGRRPNSIFNPQYYLSELSKEEAKAINDPLVHYLTVGSKQGKRPARWFDPEFYRDQYGDSIPAQMDPMVHYLTEGSKKEHKPSSDFISTKSDATKADIIVYSIIPWCDRRQRPQQLALHFAKRGHRVFYIDCIFRFEPTSIGFADIEKLEENVHVISLICSGEEEIKFYNRVLNQGQTKELTKSMTAMRDCFDIKNATSIIEFPTWGPVAESFPQDLIVFDCMDHLAGFNIDPALVVEEEELVNTADVLIVTAEALRQSHIHRKDLRLVRNGADVEFFKKKPEKLALKPDKKVVIGYFGAIAEWFDTALVQHIARSRPDWQIVLVGGISRPVEALRSYANILLTEEVPYQELPSYVYTFDVCIIPFKILDLTISTNPVKAYEYLSAGKPVVATPMPEVLLMDGLVEVGRTPEEFLEKIEECLLTKDDPNLIAKRIAWASQQTWAKRAEEFNEAIIATMPKVSVVVLTYNNVEVTKKCVESLLQHTAYPNWELILVDNASQDETASYLNEMAAKNARVKAIINTDNFGFSGGNNVGIKAATGEYIVVLNNDTYVTDGWLFGLVRHLRLNPRLGLIGPVTNNIGNEAKIDIEYKTMSEMLEKAREYTSAHARDLLPINNLAFFCVAMRRSLIDEIGLLDERFWPGFYEDDDYCLRVRNAGYQIAVAEDVFVHHELSSTWNATRQAERQKWLDHNRKIFEEKWGVEWKMHQYRPAVR